MDWIKIKAEHISPIYNNAQVGALVRFQLLVATLGRIPKREEITKLINSNCLVSLESKMSLLGVDLKYIASKVLEDRESIDSKRKNDRDRKRKYRENKELSHGTVTDSHSAIIEEKKYNRIEENIKKNTLASIPKRTPAKIIKFKKPEESEVMEYMVEYVSTKAPDVPISSIETNSERFCNYYVSNGWKVAGRQMKDWKAAVRNWALRSIDNGDIKPKEEDPDERLKRMYREAGLDVD